MGRPIYVDIPFPIAPEYTPEPGEEWVCPISHAQAVSWLQRHRIRIHADMTMLQRRRSRIRSGHPHIRVKFVYAEYKGCRASALAQGSCNRKTTAEQRIVEMFIRHSGDY